ncbi:MAG: hypothetical protein PVH54_03065 [Gammaproteobacteria bacterium]|jgi:hypothetical protein
MTLYVRILFVTALFASSLTQAATTVPIEVQMPGTQPEDNVSLDLSGGCDQCHLYSNPVVTIVPDWRGSIMSHAGRDPLFWATVAIAEQDFDGSGDLCIRCHSMSGWLDGESTPTDGSTLSSSNAAEGVGCETCHKMTNPNDSEHIGEQNAPFVANDGGDPATGHYGSAQLSMWNDQDRLGPYSDAEARHKWLPSQFHRSVDFCGSCHDVSNPVVGDLAHNNGAQIPLPPEDQFTKYGGTTLEQKAAFNYFPYQFGVVERTYSEYKAGLLSRTRVAVTTDAGDLDYNDLPAELKVAGGSIDVSRQAALGAGTGGDYADGTPRYFSCQTCHMRATTAKGCKINNVPVRTDQPMHDLTGGNYWMPDVLEYMDGENTLVAGGDLTPLEISSLIDGKQRALDNLENAATLSVTGNTVKVVNLTGHKLISGYPEGRRMWLMIKWYDVADPDPLVDDPIHIDGEYGPLQLTWDVNQDGAVNQSDKVDTILDLDGTNTRIYEAHGAITQQWATQLVGLNAAYGSVPVSYDRISGTADYTVSQVAAQAPGTHHETFHFVLNNQVVKDNRIPPYGMAYDEAAVRSILPVPETRYGNPGPGGIYNYRDEVTLNPPPGAVSAIIELMYQPTSWEYINFLYQANNGSISFLASEGANILDAWLNTGMAEPHVMETVNWTDTCGTDPDPLNEDFDNDGLGDVCDTDDDDDGLGDITEQYIGTDPLDVDTDNDGVTDYIETLFNTVAGYQPDEDTDPTDPDTDNDSLSDGADPIPLLFNYANGDVVTNDDVNGGDLLVTMQLALGVRATTDHDLAYVDLYPSGAPDGAVTLSDYIVLLGIVLTN